MFGCVLATLALTLTISFVYSDTDLFLTISFFVLSIILAIYAIILGKKRINEMSVRKKLMNENGAAVIIEGNHFSGLPMEKDSFCKVFLCPDKYRFITYTGFYDLSFHKVIDIVIQCEKQTIYACSKFPSGKITRKIYFYYDNDGVRGCIVIDCANDRNANKFLKEFKARKANKQGKNQQNFV